MYTLWECNTEIGRKLPMSVCRSFLSTVSFTDCLPEISGSFYWHGLIWIRAWISNHIPSKVWDEITYPFLNFRWSLGMDKWFHTTLYNGCNYLSMLGLKLMLMKGDPGLTVPHPPWTWLAKQMANTQTATCLTNGLWIHKQNLMKMPFILFLFSITHSGHHNCACVIKI